MGKNLHSRCLQLSDEAGKQRNFEFLPKGNALKRRTQEKQEETRGFEEALQVLQKEERRL